eukprot:21482-Heterococcus_DN1.PRE.3
MAFLLAHSPDISADVLSSMLNAAGAHDNLAAAKWLRQQGAEWPDVIRYFYVNSFDGYTEWSGEALAWARAEGCTSPTQQESDSDSDADF